MSQNKPKKAIVGVEQREESKHPEAVLANQISIMDYAHKKGLIVNYEDEKSARIKDLLTDDEIQVNKLDNSWRIKEETGWQRGHTIRFVERMEETHWSAVIDNLVEDRGKYLSSKEYNEQYAKQHGLQTELKEEAVSQEKTKEVKQGGNVATDAEPVEIPTPTHFTKFQMAEILAGTKRGLDIKVYDKIELSPEQMRELRLGLEKDVNLSKFAFKQVPAEYIKEVRLAAQDGLDLKVFALKKKECVYTPEQAREIRLGLKAGLNQEQMKVFMRKDLKPDVMHEIRLGLQDGFNVMADFNNGLYTANDIHTVRMHLMVKQIVEFLKMKMSMIFEQVTSAIKNNLHKQEPNLSVQDVQEESELLIKDTVKTLYEAIEESISEKDIDDKKQILAGVFQKIVAIGNAIEEIYPDKDKAEVFQEAASGVEETIQQKSMNGKALDALKTDYSEKFAESEQKHNIQIVELSEKLMNETELTLLQKKEVLMDNLNYDMSESAIDSFIEHLPQPVDNRFMNQYQQEITEYFEEFEMEQ